MIYGTLLDTKFSRGVYMRINKMLIATLIFMIIIISGCSSDKIDKNITPSIKKDVELNIVTTNKLLYCAVKEIVGEKHMVEYLFSKEQDLKDYTFTEDSISNIEKKDLFIYCGAGFEPWSDKFVEKLSKGDLGIINASRGVKILSYSSYETDKNTNGKDIPYYWMNIDNYKIVLQNIKNAIEEKDPKNRSYYEKNFSDSLKKVEKYQKELKGTVTELKSYTFIINGDELDYFLKYTGLKYVKIPNDNYSEVIRKINGDTKLIYLYSQDTKLEKDSEFIKLNNLNTIKLLVYNDKNCYEELLKDNIGILKGVKASEVK